ncbi:MAG TPA: hypothetical protein DF984_03070 [Anaerolineaceae bacterium]|jgi:hypothetical protein|nr:hypothetical protein [Anaerolineaceae bacterium]
MWFNQSHRLLAVFRSAIIVIVFSILFGVCFPASVSQDVSAQTVSTCLNRVNIPISDMHWVYVPESADQLYTEEKYYFLAGQLISHHIVDASDCPSGGLMLNGYANACGMEKAFQTVIVVQNMLNEPILQAWEDVGVPPVLLKQLIANESQFWPSQYSLFHYGFGHITNIGIRNAVQWNPNLYSKVCPESEDGSCVTNISAAYQILASLINTCDTCEFGIDPYMANRSVDILAESLLGYCYQTERLIVNATGWHSSIATDYATIWKLTLMDYNAGSQCVYDTLVSTFEATQGPMNWSDISAHVSGDLCVRGVYYANQITTKVFDFPPSD